MLQKWKTIITNWIHCYFSEGDIREQCITLESVLNIISHLRENLSLDESKSSTLEAHTVEEFIREKYPEFRFNNGTVEADTLEDLYMVASLLLLFVCVNSKDVDIKTAMCSKLSIQDQEVIMKFSKCLLECSQIKLKDVHSAINDACGHESVVTELENPPSVVSETPPALRSLHSEVRRLQAALDAERFDRNYLQEELSRTNLRLEKLLKDKEQYNLDIVNLKAKISMCCGQESDTKVSDMVAEGTAKLMKQLEQIEEKLVETQGQLDDAQYERDTYRAKVSELKQERDKLAAFHQQESSRNTQLSDELESERRTVISLRELVVELRQHQQLNKMDSSQLECDDPDASIQSLQHNSSICSEACANVVEVQLGEERANIVLLKQQIQALQEQLNALTQKSETEKLSLEKVLSEKDNDIFNLKHRISEEIEIKNNMTVHYSDEVRKLNNDINELEQRLKDNNVQSTLVIETKMQDIQTLQEEKLSLLQSLHDETTKLENIVKNLRTDLDNERTSKAKMRDDYENVLMKLNEKVLNRNNDLVELQNSVLVLREQIDGLHLELRREKQARNNEIQQFHNEIELLNARRLETENNLQQKHGEVKRLMDQLNHNTSHIDQLNAESDYFKESVSQLTQTCNTLEQSKTLLVNEISIRDNRIEAQHKEIDNWRNKVSEERDKYKKHTDDYEMRITILTKSIEETREDMSKQKESYTAVLDSRARDIQTLQQENQSLHDELNDVKLELDQKVHSLKEKLIDNENLTEKLKTTYESQIVNLNLMVTKLTNFLKDKAVEFETCKKEKERLQEVIDSNNEVITFLEEEVKSQKHNQEKLVSEFESERLVLKNMITVTESVMEDQKVSMTQMVTEYEKDNKSLKSEIELLKNSITVTDSAMEDQKVNLTQVITEYEKDNESLKREIEVLKNTFDAEKKDAERKHQEKEAALEEVNKLKQELDKLVTFNHQESSRITRLSDELECERRTVISLQELVVELRQHQQLVKMDSSQLECDDPNASIQSLQHNSSNCSEASANVVEVQLGEDQAKIVHLNQQIQTLQEQLNELTRKSETEKLSLERIISDKDNDIFNLKHRINEEIEIKNIMSLNYSDEVSKLNNDINELEQKLKDLNVQSMLVIETKMQDIQILQEEKLSLLHSLHDETTKLESTVKNLRTDLENERTSKAKMKDDYENLLMKLNEKVLNRNNELVEQQNNVLVLSEQIEGLHLELRKEKQARDNEIQQFHNELELLNAQTFETENNLQKKHDEVTRLMDQLNHNTNHIDQLNAESDYLKESVSQLTQTCKTLEHNKNSLVNEISIRDNRIEEQHKDIDNLKNKLSEERDNCKKHMDDYEMRITSLAKSIEETHEDMSKQKESYTAVVDSRARDIQTLQQENESLHNELKDVKLELDQKVHSLKEKLIDNENLTEKLKTTYESEVANLNSMVTKLTNFLKDKVLEFETCKKEKMRLQEVIHNNNEVISFLEGDLKSQKHNQEELVSEFESERLVLKNMITMTESAMDDQKVGMTQVLTKYEKDNENLKSEIEVLKNMITVTESATENQKVSMTQVITEYEKENKSLKSEIEVLKNMITVTESAKEHHKVDMTQVITEYEKDNKSLKTEIEVLKNMITGTESAMENKKVSMTQVITEYEKENKSLKSEIEVLKNMITVTESAKEHQKVDMTQVITEYEKDNKSLKTEIEVLKNMITGTESAMENQKISMMQLITTYEKDNESLKSEIEVLKNSFDDELKEAKNKLQEKETALEETVSDLEKIIHDKNRTITTLQSDITYLKSLVADSENKVLDVTNELELSKENCQQLSSQLKKIVHQKNEEIAELKRQVTKMSATENRASQIIKVSAKYQAIILKRIAEIKTNTVLKELTNFGNSANGDNEFRRSLNAGTITMEDLENFLETTDKHLRRCSEKQTNLQKERDRLTEVNRINESEIINLKKFLTELSVSFKTFSGIKELYTQKLSRVVSVQRTVRREILNLDGRINDVTMCKLERGYAAVMQDLSEAVMNLERWVERCISRTISPEKIKQAFMSDEERSSFSSATFQNTGLEVQIGELENSFQRLLEEVVRAQKGEGAKDAQAVTVMEVRAEYEDKLNRMKAKMKQLYQEQISVYQEKQKENIATMEQELLKTREKLSESSKAYEEHIRALTTELWRVGEKFLTKKDELEWLRKKQLSGSLMSLQHVHSSGLSAPPADVSRISDTHSLRSLPVHNNNTKKREGRGLHMSDEEGEVFDNRWLQQLNATPRRSPPQRSPGPRLSELRWRNSLCPPHLKSSYPAETQFAPALDEEDIKCLGKASLSGRSQRKEVGITAYKKPGPPTPSKQAGRLSATDSELRETLRFDPEPQASRKTSTPSRIRSLFRSNKNDTAEGTPRTKRLSIFRKK